MAANEHDASPRAAPHRERLNPRGRPLNYQGSRGWASRIANQTLCAAAVGAVTGLGVGIVRKENPFRWFTILGANCAIAACCFSGSQELVRELRSADPDDWVNCVLGGLASGALLGRLHGGPARALPVALVFAAVGTGLHVGTLQLREYRLQHFLASKPHEEAHDDLKSSVETRPLRSESKNKTQSGWELPEWSPIKKFNEEAAKKRALEKELQRQKTLESLHRGNFPVEDL